MRRGWARARAWGEGEGSWGEGSWGAATGGARSGGAAIGGAATGGAVSPSGGGAVGDPAGGPGAGQPPQPDLLETLSPQAIRVWIVRRGIPGGGGYGPAGAGAASPGGTAGAGGAGGAAGAGGTRGAAGAGGTRGAAGAGGTRAASPGDAGGAAHAGGAGATSPRGATGAGGAGASCLGGPAGAGGAGAAGTEGAGVAGVGGAGGAAGAGGAGAGGNRGSRAARPGGARTGGAAGAGGAGGTAGGTGGTGGARGAGVAEAGCGAGAGGAGGAAGAGGAGGAGGTAGARGAGAARARGATGAGGANEAVGAGGAGAASAGGAGAVDQSQPQLLPGSQLPAPAPHTEVTESLTERHEPETRASTCVRARRVARPRPPAVLGTHSMALRPSSIPQRVVLPQPTSSSLPHVPDPESDLARVASPTVTHLLATVITDPDFESIVAFSLVTALVDFAARSRLEYVTSLVTYVLRLLYLVELVDFAARSRPGYVASLVIESESFCPPSVGGELALGSDVLEDRQFELECLAVALPRFASMQLCPEGDPDALDIPTPRSYAEAIAGTYVDEVPPLGANIVDGMWIFRVKRPPGSPPALKARYVARGFSQRQGVDFFQTFSPNPKKTTLRVLMHIAAQCDYELHSLNFSTAFLQGSLHEEIWLRRPPGFPRSFPAGTQWSLRRLVYGLCQAPREWHDTLRTTLAALGFAPSSACLSLFLHTDTSEPPFYVLVYVLQRFGFQFYSPQPTPLSNGHSLSAPVSDESVEPSGPYPEIVGCLMYLMTCTRPDLAYPLSLLARYVAPGRHRKIHWDAAKRVMRYLCSTSGMGLVLGGQGSVVLTGHSDASWTDDQASQRSSQGYTFSLGSGSVLWRSTRSSSVLGSSCEAEIYAGAMDTQEVRWLTYLLTDLGELPRSPLVLYVDNKAMLGLCHEQRLEHRTKHISLRYFLARELQQRHQLRLSYVASRANTADVFTKALGSGDHQRFCTALGLVPTLPHLLVA
ncbi:unnamed protein product [Closterium sp. NIES-53]